MFSLQFSYKRVSRESINVGIVICIEVGYHFKFPARQLPSAWVEGGGGAAKRENGGQTLSQMSARSLTGMSGNLAQDDGGGV